MPHSPPRVPRARPRRRPARRRPWPGPTWRSIRPTPKGRNRPASAGRRGHLQPAVHDDGGRAQVREHARDRPFAGVGPCVELGVVEAPAELVQAADRAAKRNEFVVHVPRSTRRPPALLPAPASTIRGPRPTRRAGDSSGAKWAASSGSSDWKMARITSGSTWTAWRRGAISNSTATARNCSTARALLVLPHPTKATGLRRHSTNVESSAFFKHGRVAVVVLRGEDDVAVGAVHHPAEPDHGLVGVVAAGPHGRVAVEEGERVVAEVDQLDLERVVLPPAGTSPRPRPAR